MPDHTILLLVLIAMGLLTTAYVAISVSDPKLDDDEP